MNAVEIEEAVSELVAEPFDGTEFPYKFLQAFGNKETTLRKLRSGDTNKSDVGGVLQRNNIHLAVAPLSEVSVTLAALRASPATAKHRVKFIVATDGETVEAEELGSGEPLACAWRELPDHFGFFLPLAGITTVKEIRENAFDIRATSKLNKLYLALLRENPEWGSAERRPDMNHFMARLIFSFFAEDTGIFPEDRLFTNTVSQMSAADSSNTHEVVGAVFRAMNTRQTDRADAGVPRWALPFPYVNGGLFSGALDVPRFSRTARAYLLQVGSLDWKQINPDIFGSMIQAVADDEERGALGLHYTSVPNILKVLNPLFLDDLRAKLEEAGDNPRTLLNLRKRIARIRVFDPACGSGNFLVIAYKELRAIEHEINRRRGEAGRRSEIPLTNFRGIELRDFAAEIARLALIIAEFQCDELYRSQQDAIQDFLPLDAENWITCDNALRIDWLSICPPTGTQVRLVGDDLFSTPLDQPEIDFENAGGETYICGNPPYQGSVDQSAEQKQDMARVFNPYLKAYKDLDYVAAWFVRAAEYARRTSASLALVATNSICQGEQVAMLWPILFKLGRRIAFAHTSFPWRNSAARNAGVTCVIIGLREQGPGPAVLFDGERARSVESIGPYLVPGSDCIVKKRSHPLASLAPMLSGNKATDGGNLVLSKTDMHSLLAEAPNARQYVRWLKGSRECIHGTTRWCLWIDDADVDEAKEEPAIARRLDAVAALRRRSRGKQANAAASKSHRFVYAPHATGGSILVPSVSSERRPYFPVALFDEKTIISNLAFALYEAPLWNVALIASRLHLVWIATVCGKLETRYRYSNTLGWNTFPVPTLTEQNKLDLTRCAEDILLAREAHYPATIAELYSEKMPANLREAHERNDEVLERIYIGRRFRNDTERLEKLFVMYTQMTANETRPAAGRRKHA
ncbi:MAG TPA: DNA methyltransferase [Longimicrobium sp.]|jgi:hypothetical protein